MHGRIKVKILSTALNRWKTVYILPNMLYANITLFKAYEIGFKICG